MLRCPTISISFVCTCQVPPTSSCHGAQPQGVRGPHVLPTDASAGMARRRTLAGQRSQIQNCLRYLPLGFDADFYCTLVLHSSGQRHSEVEKTDVVVASVVASVVDRWSKRRHLLGLSQILCWSQKVYNFIFTRWCGNSRLNKQWLHCRKLQFLLVIWFIRGLVDLKISYC